MQQLGHSQWFSLVFEVKAAEEHGVLLAELHESLGAVWWQRVVAALENGVIDLRFLMSYWRVFANPKLFQTWPWNLSSRTGVASSWEGLPDRWFRPPFLLIKSR